MILLQTFIFSAENERRKYEKAAWQTANQEIKEMYLQMASDARDYTRDLQKRLMDDKYHNFR
ncbi:MAG: hypothetical protein H7Y04_09090 [Verrucomicrobia bacterium]|nr:hypothetical protein [Cytophagales bacterium]